MNDRLCPAVDSAAPVYGVLRVGLGDSGPCYMESVDLAIFEKLPALPICFAVQSLRIYT